jgi:predicted component of type VI protein secretion system
MSRVALEHEEWNDIKACVTVYGKVKEVIIGRQNQDGRFRITSEAARTIDGHVFEVKQNDQEPLILTVTYKQPREPICHVSR